MLLRNFTLFLGLLLLSSCGFRPLYRAEESADVVQLMEQTRVNLIKNRTGQRLRTLLMMRMSPNGDPSNPVYVLDVDLEETTRQLGYLRDATSSRAILNLEAKYALKDAKTGKTVFMGSQMASANYSILRSPVDSSRLNTSDYSTMVSEDGCRGRAINQLAHDLKLQIALRLRELNRPQAAKSKG